MNIYEKLLDATDKLPKEAIEKATKEVTRKGYDTTGYQYQFIVNVFNEVLGIGEWGFDYTIIKETEGKWNSGKSFWEITASVSIWIHISEKVVTFSCVGGHKSEMHADALKGAITNGFKKTAAFFGVGKKAYEGTIDEDYRPVPVANNKPKLVAPKPKETKQVDLGTEPENPEGVQEMEEVKKPDPKPEIADINARLKKAKEVLPEDDFNYIMGQHKCKTVKDIKSIAQAKKILASMEQVIKASEVNE